MKKVFVVISWIIAIVGAIAISLATWFVDNYILFWVGVPMLIIGIVGLLLLGDKSRKFIVNLFGFL